MTKLSIKPGRLLSTIHETLAAFGAKGVWGSEPTQTGVCRLSLSNFDKQVRDWFVSETKKLGCTVKVDEVGNIFSEFPGKKKGKPTAIGSHLDTQPTGGRYDGIYGVLSGLEVLRTMKDNNYTPEYPITVIDWTNEEGARFPMSIMASLVWAGNVTKEKVHSIKAIDQPGVSEPTVLEELERIGYLGDTPALYKENPIAAYFEIHIEQGPILEENNELIGVVTSVQAYTWVTTRIYGRAQHTGTTPLRSRSDAMLLASKMMIKGNEIAEKHNGLFSVGVLKVEPAAVNVIPEYVEFVYDIRHPSDEGRAAIQEEVEREFRAIVDNKANGLHTKIEFDVIYTSPAVKFHEDCISCVRSAAESIVGKDKMREMGSGAGHDACATSDRVPTSMIFIPSKDGISHNPAEYSKPEEIDLGFRVLLEAVISYDKKRTE